MERWQKAYLKVNIQQLVVHTICNEKLLMSLESNGALLIGDMDKIKGHEDKTKQSEVLFDIVESRKNAFLPLTKSLKDCKQSESFEILLEGLKMHGLGAITISMMGIVKPLKDFFNNADIEDVLFNLQNCLTSRQQHDLFLKGNEPINLLIDTIPNQHPNYIPRSLSKRTKAADNVILEDKIIETVSGRVCIYNTPGTGKSLLLASLARQLSRSHPERITSFIHLPHFIDYLSRQGNKFEMGAQCVRKYILKYTSASQVAHCLLTEIVSRGTICMQIFLDGFDQISPKHAKFANSVLKEILNIENANVYMTCGSENTLHNLETTFKFVPYEIIPLDENQEITLLTSIWLQVNPDNDPDKLEEFAWHCIQKLKAIRAHRDMAGIPLQCRLLAECYAEQATNFATSNQITFLEDFDNFPNSIPELYQMFMDNRFQKFDNQSEKLNMKKRHVLTALQILFPEMANELALSLGVKKSSQEIDVESVGLLQSHVTGIGCILQFANASFGQYLASEYLVDVLQQQSQQDAWTAVNQRKIIKFLFETVLTVRNPTSEETHPIFFYPGLLHFLNFHFENVDITPLSKITVELFLAFIPPEPLYSIFLCSFRHNFSSIFTIFVDIFAKVKKSELKTYANYFNQKNGSSRLITLLYEAAKYSDVSLVNDLFLLSSDHFNFDLGSLCDNIPVQNLTPLHFAIHKANFELADYFADMISLEGRCLLYECVEWSASDSSEMVEKKLEICQMLLEKNIELLREPKYITATRRFDSPLGGEKIHLRLIKFLVKQGADPRATIFDRKTVVHRAAEYMSSNDLHELCRFLIQDCQAVDLFNPCGTAYSDICPCYTWQT